MILALTFQENFDDVHGLRGDGNISQGRDASATAYEKEVSRGSSIGRLMTIDDFAIKKFLGEGSYGKVALAIDKINPSQKYAMKAIEKY